MQCADSDEPIYDLKVIEENGHNCYSEMNVGEDDERAEKEMIC